MNRWFSVVLMTVGFAHAKLPVDYIDPMIGAVTYRQDTKDNHGLGKTFPGAATPFGLVQLSPDTITGGDNGSGYSYEHPTIEGFSFTHMSGIGWYGDLGNFLVTPTTGKLKTNRGDPEHPETGYRSRFSHETEIAKAGYYAATLSDYDIRAELTAAPHAGILRFTFSENEQSRIQIDLSRRVGGTSTEQYVEVVDERTIRGWMKCPPEGGGWGNGAGQADYTVYFYCQFSKPLKKHGVWRAELPDDWTRKRPDIESAAYQQVVASAEVVYDQHSAQGKHLGFFSEFSTKEGEAVLVKSGISFVSMEGAQQNLEHDIPHWDFDAVAKGSRARWNAALSRVKVEGGSDADRVKFYTALYHTMIDPRSASDVNGKYIGADGAVHQTDGFTYRTIFSGWDVFRSQFPLQTLINPQMVNDEVNSLLQLAELSGKGYLPRWEILNAYSGCMLGNPGVSVIVDAHEKGIRNYDVEKAFTYCKNTVDTFGNGERGYAEGKKGVISETLEYAYTDWCLGRFAESLGKEGIADDYYEKSKAYTNLWNEEVRWFRAKDDAGNWIEWEGKTVHGQGCRESNPFQQGWFVPHDIPGLVKMMGREFFVQELVSFFDNTPDDFLWNDYYNHANEPVHQVPFMFNEIGMPWLTQKWTRKICDTAYGTDRYGICGNEDVGQMSAWYVLAAMGIHPICPGDNKYQIISPVFSRIEMQLDPKYYPGATFTIVAKNNSPENIYIQSITLNGKPLDRFYILHDEIVSGGILELEMGSEPALLSKINKDESPNIILILADDMGWGDTGYNGNAVQKTPFLDKMAAEGIRFDRFYSASTVCAPTRASIMTGQNGARLGISHWGSSHVQAGDILISEFLKGKGYATGHFGKWHLGLLDKEGTHDFVAGPRTPEKDFSPPWQNGFDVCFSTENVAPTWDPMKLPDQGAWGQKKRYETGLWGNNYWNQKGEMIDHHDNLSGDDSRIIMDRVIPFVKEQANEPNPFFAYVCFHTPHTPTVSGGKYLEMYKGHAGRHHYGAITAMDEQIGRLRQALRELGEDENTLIWFCSDNGAAENKSYKFGDYGGFGSNGPYRDWKGSMYEGGIRVPGLLLYPKVFKEHAVIDMPCSTADMFPMLAALLGDPDAERSQPQDGISILPALNGGMTVRNSPMGFAYSKNAAWMTERHKLIVGIGGNKAGPELYDMIEDPYEKRDIADQNPEMVAEMKAALGNWIQSCNESCGDRYKPVPMPN